MKAALGISATAIKLRPEGFPKLLSCRRGENLYGLPVSIATIGAISKTAGNQDPEKPPNPTHPGKEMIPVTRPCRWRSWWTHLSTLLYQKSLP